MKILHLSTWKTGGAAIAATRLSNQLNKMGVDSLILNMSSKLPAYVDAAIGKLTHTKNPIFHSYNYYGENISRTIAELNPDIIHVHWIGAGFITPESLSKFNLPIVWTLHDLWPLCGAEHLPNSKRFQVGYLKNNRPTGESGFDLDRLVWQRKMKAFGKLDITYVAPSQYVYATAKTAKAINGHNLAYIANGVDTSIFGKSAIKLTDKLIILFVANNPTLDLNKGYADFQKAINLLPTKLKQNIEVKIVGGEVVRESEMASIYASATVTVVASRMETLSFVTMESLVCGTPVVAYNVGGIPDLVEHGKNGYLAKAYDVKGLSRGIEKIITSSVLQKEYGRYGREKIVKLFNLSVIAKKYQELYETLI